MVYNTCVYLHKKPNGEVFYVGIGNIKRPFWKFRDNPHWNNVIKKHPDYKIEIISQNLDWQTACELEKKLISEYKRKIDGGNLCNITLGGDGAKGLKHSEETKQILKELSTGNKNCVGYKHSEETKKNMRLSHIGHIISEEAKLKMSLAQKGRKGRESDKFNSLKAHEKNRGRVHSEEEKIKRKQALRKSLGKKIEVNGIIYPTIITYCEEFNLNRSSVVSKLRNINIKNFNYI
jgi:hypothetical protein